MLVACYGYEGMYMGLHGVETLEVLEVSDNAEKAIEEINDWGREATDELISQYGLESEYEEAAETEDYTESHYYCDRGWAAYKIRDFEVETLGKAELNKLLATEGIDIFKNEYCEGDSIV